MGTYFEVFDQFLYKFPFAETFAPYGNAVFSNHKIWQRVHICIQRISHFNEHERAISFGFDGAIVDGLLELKSD